MATTENSLQYYEEKDPIFQDRSLVRAALMGYGENLQYCPLTIRNDKELVMTAVRNNRIGLALEFASEEMRDDKEIVEESMKYFASSFRFASERIRNDKEMGLKAISYLASNILYLSESLQKDDDIIMKALELDSELILAVNFKREEMMENKKILIKLLESCSLYCKMYIFTFLKERKSVLLKDQQVLRKFVLLQKVKHVDYSVGELIKMVVETCDLEIDREIILKQVELFKYAPVEIRSDIDFVKYLILKRKRGDVLEFATDNLKDDLSVVRHAISAPTGNAFRFASDRLRNNQDICFRAVIFSPSQFMYASDGLKSNKEFILKMINLSAKRLFYDRESSIFEFIDEKLKFDSEFVKKLLKLDHTIVSYIPNIDKEMFNILMDKNALNYVPETVLHQYRNEVIEYLTNNPHNYCTVASKFPNDKELALKFLRLSPDGVWYLSTQLQEDPDITSKLDRYDEFSSKYSNLDIRSHRRQVKEHLKEKPWSLNSLPIEFQKDREIVLEAVKLTGSISITEFFRNDREMALEALKYGRFNLGDVSTDFRKDKEIVEKAILQDLSNLFYADYVFKSDREFVKKCLVGNNCFSTQIFIPEYIRDDIEIAKTLLEKSGTSFFSCMSERLRNDRSLAMPILKQRPYLLSESPSIMKDKNAVLEIIKDTSYDYFVFQNLPEELQEDLDILRAFFNKYPQDAVQYCKDSGNMVWTQHKDLVKIVLPHYKDAFYKASKEVQRDLEIRVIFNSINLKNALTIQRLE